MFNNGEETLVCLVIGQRLEQDVGDYPRLAKRLYRNSGEWNLVDHDDIGTSSAESCVTLPRAVLTRLPCRSIAPRRWSSASAR